MTWMNEYEVEEATRLYDAVDTPNLAKAAQALSGLVSWVNSNSDGWPYWAPPSRASQGLQKALTAARQDYYRGREVVDLPDAALATLLRPVKAFLTKQGANHAEVL